MVHGKVNILSQKVPWDKNGIINGWLQLPGGEKKDYKWLVMVTASWGKSRL